MGDNNIYISRNCGQPTWLPRLFFSRVIVALLHFCYVLTYKILFV